ncbi:class I SAM-dependent methyltransferase [uncultured Legionella sp.]|uniref:class I SAM-dependent methyltransferase n=1 Tax=uncultured Legionella sp. TaxID=210934 RepID=UPI00261C8BE8|nr:class I SAM-dependent methyltransferase [uncultured Legionella sp.]
MNSVSKEYVGHFNQNSDQYLLCRPDYPEALFDYLAQLVDPNVIVWDCGTGNGQAAKALAERFSRVIATDINQAQLDMAIKAANIDYICTPVEKAPIQSHSIGLITVAQALHWFDFSLFYNEVKRVSVANGIIAAWCYSLGVFNNLIDAPIKKLYYEILGNEFWPKERFYIDEQYQTIPFPFTLLNAPEFQIRKRLDFSQLIGYLSTWSAVKEFQKRQQKNPIELVFDELESQWGEPDLAHEIVWPVHCLIGRVHG